MQKKKLIQLDPEKLFKLFVSRSDKIAFQRPDGRYAGNVPADSKKWLDYLKEHLAGRLTAGAYSLDGKNNAKWLCLDIDCKHDIKKAEILCQKLSFFLSEDLNLPHSIELSGSKGFHIWFFMENPAPAHILRAFAHWFLGSHAGLKKLNESEYAEYISGEKINVEIYPKQDNTTGIGSLVKVPMGIHRVTNCKSDFIKFTDKTLEIKSLVRFIKTKRKISPPPFKIGNASAMPHSAGEWNVYRSLKEICKEGQSVKISLKKLAAQTGYTRQTAAKWMHSLSSKGIISTELLPTGCFTVFRPKYNRTTKLIKREYFVTIGYTNQEILIKKYQDKPYQPSFKINAPYRKDLHPSLVYLPMIGIWKDFATGQIFQKNDPVLKNFTSMTVL
jgi:hypothetical protein